MMDTSDNEDMHSQHSHSSHGMPIALTTKKESGGDQSPTVLSKPPISVKEMIKRYNTAALNTPTALQSSARQQSVSPPSSAHHGLTAHSSSYCELNKYSDMTAEHSGEASPIRRSDSACNMHFVSCYGSAGEEYMPVTTSRHSSMTGLTAGMGEYIADHTCRSTGSPTFLDDEPCQVQFLATGGCEMASRKSNTVILNKSSPDLTASLDSCYQSKTVISKTPMGVRITIDIFFEEGDQPLLEMDMLGSRIETDIPQSRILQEFQQEAKKKLKTESKDKE